ncbi:TetR/AcrR family transcriptional regulator [Lactiplantibacillus carotarum]|uniref:TetR/AcrR family transcriptional regulator n=1 Tax=Lactiplantibacillus carotarum TaxID=2993456 RepID=UPI00298F0163|nr:TetR/AcrR family transcriptional regulator [Lactiplantibacillus carotarum]
MTPAKRREQLLRATIVAINRTGFRQLKMEDFVRIMPASRSTVYRYFPAREAVITAVVDEYVDYVQQLRLPDTVGNWVSGFSQLLNQAISLNGYLSPVFLDDLAYEAPTEAQRLRATLQRYFQREAEYYQAGQRAGIFNAQNVRLWQLQDRTLLPKLLDPQVLAGERLTVTNALRDYAAMKRYQVLRPAYVDQVDEHALDATLTNIMRYY